MCLDAVNALSTHYFVCGKLPARAFTVQSLSNSSLHRNDVRCLSPPRVLGVKRKSRWSWYKDYRKRFSSTHEIFVRLLGSFARPGQRACRHPSGFPSPRWSYHLGSSLSDAGPEGPLPRLAVTWNTPQCRRRDFWPGHRLTRL